MVRIPEILPPYGAVGSLIEMPCEMSAHFPNSESAIRNGAKSREINARVLANSEKMRIFPAK
jgi:hypothetical protein